MLELWYEVFAIADIYAKLGFPFFETPGIFWEHLEKCKNHGRPINIRIPNFLCDIQQKTKT